MVYNLDDEMKGFLVKTEDRRLKNLFYRKRNDFIFIIKYN